MQDDRGTSTLHEGRHTQSSIAVTAVRVVQTIVLTSILAAQTYAVPMAPLVSPSCRRNRMAQPAESMTKLENADK